MQLCGLAHAFVHADMTVHVNITCSCAFIESVLFSDECCGKAARFCFCETALKKKKKKAITQRFFLTLFIKHLKQYLNHHGAFNSPLKPQKNEAALALEGDSGIHLEVERDCAECAKEN